MGSLNEANRLVPLTQARLIPTSIPRSLAALQLKNIQIEAPSIPPSHKKHGTKGEVSMNNLMEVARKHREKLKSENSLSSMFVDVDKASTEHGKGEIDFIELE